MLRVVSDDCGARGVDRGSLGVQRILEGGGSVPVCRVWGWSGRGAVAAGVDRVLAVMSASGAAADCSASGAARAWAAAAGRVLVIEDVVLAPGVFGQWLRLPERDVVQVGAAVVGRDWTVAHELGHMVLGHRGTPVVDVASVGMQVLSPDVVALMLQRTCASSGAADDGGVWSADEVAAEQFAMLLTRRLQAGRWRRRGWVHHLDDALG